jgi:hypothetical protein
MVEIFGWNVELLDLLRVAVTAATIGLFSAFSYLQLDDALWLSEVESANLARIALEGHPDIKSLEDLLERPPPYDDEADERLYNKEDTIKLIESNTDLARAPWRSGSVRTRLGRAGAALVLPLIAPISWVPLIMHYQDRHRMRGERIFTTAGRRVIFSIYTLFAASSVVYLVIGVANAEKHPWVGYSVSAVALVGLLGAVGGLVATTTDQAKWRLFWRACLGELALIAMAEKNETVYTRAVLAKESIDSAPAVPLPTAIGFYAAVFSGAQVALTALSSAVTWI